ncbi:MAG: DNA-methyltransferase [Planctomycetota bacterium]|jgi:site-specific DNA-methyltransferase (adenine-specific)
MSNINLIQGDGQEAIKAYPDNAFEWAIIDPPYGLKEAAGKNLTRKKPVFGGQQLTHPTPYAAKEWDNQPAPPEFFQELLRVSKNQIIFGANHFIENIPNANSPCWIVWDKDNGNSHFADCELAWCSAKTAVRKVKFRWNGLLQQDMKNKEKRIHPTQKPVSLYKWILRTYTKPGDLILDTHLGSGSIAIACHYTKRRLTAYEIDPEYYEAALKRFKEQTAQRAMF